MKAIGGLAGPAVDMKALQALLLLLLALLGARALPFGDGKPAMGFNTCVWDWPELPWL